MELTAESNRLVEGLQLRLEVLVNFSSILKELEWMNQNDQSESRTVPRFWKTGPVRSQKPESN